MFVILASAHTYFSSTLVLLASTYSPFTLVIVQSFAIFSLQITSATRMATFNEQLAERFGKGPARFAGQDFTLVTHSQSNPPPTVNYSIRQYANAKVDVPGTWGFTDKREIPTQDEISTTDDPDDLLKVPYNEVVGPWPSKLKYLYNHYELLREDAIAPLRNVVSEMRAEPHIMEKDSVEDSHIYEKV